MPVRGEVWLVDLGPDRGSEQRGIRPAVLLLLLGAQLAMVGACEPDRSSGGPSGRGSDTSDATNGRDQGTDGPGIPQDGGVLADLTVDLDTLDLATDTGTTASRFEAGVADHGTQLDARAAVQDLGPGDPDAGDAPPWGELRVVILNTHSFQEGADSLDKLRWIGEGLGHLRADLVGLNEVMSGTFWAYDYQGVVYDGTEIIRLALERVSRVPWYVHRQGFAHWADGEEMANVLLSRFPILDSDHAWLTTTDFWPGPQEQRCVIYGRVEVPGLGLVNVFVTHTAGFDSADTETQIHEVKAFMAREFGGNEALDLLLGDLNTPSTWPAYHLWLHTPPFELIDTYAASHPDGVSDPTQLDGEHRIDYVLAGAGWPISEDPGCYRSALIFDGTSVEGVLLPRVSDHKGVLTIFHLAACGGLEKPAR